MKSILALVTALLLTLSTFTSFAQDSTKSEGKIREYVLTLSNIAPLNVGIRYKKQTREKTFFKVGLVNLNGSISNMDPFLSTYFPFKLYNFSVGFELGFEFRKSLNNSFTFFHGPNVTLATTQRFRKYKDPSASLNNMQTIYQSNNLGLTYTLGILLHLKGHFFMSAEINPGVFYTYSRQENTTDIHTQSIGFANSFGLISLVYRR